MPAAQSGQQKATLKLLQRIQTGEWLAEISGSAGEQTLRGMLAGATPHQLWFTALHAAVSQLPQATIIEVICQDISLGTIYLAPKPSARHKEELLALRKLVSDYKYQLRFKVPPKTTASATPTTSPVNELFSPNLE